MPSRRASIRAALRTGHELGKLFAQLGTAEHPRGTVLVAYRNARRALRDVLRRKSPMIALEAREVMSELEARVRIVADTALTAAVALGEMQANIEARVWGLEPVIPFVDAVAMSDAWVGIVEQQERAILATLAIGADPALILGSDTTIGLLNPSPVTREGTSWLSVAAGLALVGALRPAMESSGIRWGKQAIASVGARTTDCCLGVHGQVVPIDKPFHTTNPPAFADYQDWPRFHWHCRTSGSFVPMDEADDDLTGMLLEQSKKEQGKRWDARWRIAEINRELVDRNTMPDARRRKDDTAAITELREELLELRQRGGYDS